MTTNPTAPSGAVKPPAPAGRHRITDYDSLIDELAYTYDGTFSRASIAQAVAEARAALEPTARIADSCQSLSPASPVNSSPLRRKRQARSPNRFQSCCSSASKTPGGRRWRPRSPSTCRPAASTSVPPGRTRLTRSNPVAVQVLAERGINLTEAYPKPLTGDVVHAADVIVTMGCGDTCPIYPGKRYLDWDVPDPNDRPIEEVRDIRDDLQARVTALLRDLHI